MEVAILHHTQCGMGFLADLRPSGHGYAARTGLADVGTRGGRRWSTRKSRCAPDVERLLFVQAGRRPGSWSRDTSMDLATGAGHHRAAGLCTARRRTDVSRMSVQSAMAGSNVPDVSRVKRPGLVLAVVLLAAFAINLDTTIVNVALPSFSRQLHASTSDLQWIVDGYNLAFAGLSSPVAPSGTVRPPRDPRRRARHLRRRRASARPSGGPGT